MITITQAQARDRFKALPPLLQDAIFSIHTAETIARIAEQNHMPDNKIGAIGEVTGLVFLGFLHPEEVAPELAERAGIAPLAAKTIADSIDNRLFRPIRDEIDRVYAPAGPEPIRIVTEISSAARGGGWSPIKPNAPRVFPLPPQIPASSPISMERTPIGQAFNEKKSPVMPDGPEPVFLHRETEAEPGKKIPDVTLGGNVTRGPSQDLLKKAPSSVFQPSLKPAKIEMGFSRGMPPKTVNYTELRAPAAKEPQKPLPPLGASALPPSSFMKPPPQTPSFTLKPPSIPTPPPPVAPPPPPKIPEPQKPPLPSMPPAIPFTPPSPKAPLPPAPPPPPKPTWTEPSKMAAIRIPSGPGTTQDSRVPTPPAPVPLPPKKEGEGVIDIEKLRTIAGSDNTTK